MSCDTPAGGPFNILETALLTHMLAQQSGLDVGELVWTVGDAHIYEEQFEAVYEWLSRTPSEEKPQLKLNKAKDLFSYSFEDFEITNYNPGSRIKIPISI